ncbi:4'-phosphopantetheinyl transferase family protein [Marinomonas primoryensis]|uniref:Enterobactin synthase component D n=1 Tax=Marinomonas primoryensis TaxID=178399 RepID=A0ABV0KZC4_9GAMM
MKRFYQTQIRLSESGYVNVSHFCFIEGSLVGTDYDMTITKPLDYEKWRSKRQETFLAGRLAVRHAQAYLNEPAKDILKAEDGSPLWPGEYTGSISHTDNQAVAVLLPQAQGDIQYIGIDLERLVNADKLDIAHLIGLEREFKILIAEGMEKSFLVLLLFSLKESVYKALYPAVREFFDFLDVELISKDGNDFFEFQVKRQLSEKIPSGFILRGSYVIQDEHVMTWAYC